MFLFLLKTDIHTEIYLWYTSFALCMDLMEWPQLWVVHKLGNSFKGFSSPPLSSCVIFWLNPPYPNLNDRIYEQTIEIATKVCFERCNPSLEPIFRQEVDFDVFEVAGLTFTSNFSLLEFYIDPFPCHCHLPFFAWPPPSLYHICVIFAPPPLFWWVNLWVAPNPKRDRAAL